MNFFHWLKSHWWFIVGFVGLLLSIILLSIEISFDEVSDGFYSGGIFVHFMLFSFLAYTIQLIILASRKKPVKVPDWFIIAGIGFILSILIGVVSHGLEGLGQALIVLVGFPMVLAPSFVELFFKSYSDSFFSYFIIVYDALFVAWFVLEYFASRQNWYVWVKRCILILFFLVVVLGMHSCLNNSF